MERILNYKVSENDAGKTIEVFLKEKGCSHAVLVQLKKTQNGITRNDTWAYTNEKLCKDDELSIRLIEHENSINIEPVNIKLDIVYEDEDIIVINKPSGMPVHPSMGNHTNTLANALMYYYKNQNKDFVFRCVNRLDKDTTGLTMIAKNSLSAAVLSNAVAKKQLQRQYTAICCEKIDSPLTIDCPIARLNGSTIERCVDYENGERAVTHCFPLKYNPQMDLSLISLVLETGRTHQIRVHMKYIGHPLIGDFLYNPDYRYIQRQSLHSACLEFIHPVTQKKMTLHAPLPPDMKFIL